MTQLLILDTKILAQGQFTVTESNVLCADINYPKDTIEGFEIVDVTIPDGFQCFNYLYIDGELQEKTPTPAPVVIPTVSPFQLRLALNQLSMREAVEAVVAAASQEIKDGWEYATEFRRDNALIAAMTPVLGYTESEIDDVFLLAATLNA